MRPSKSPRSTAAPTRQSSSTASSAPSSASESRRNEHALARDLRAPAGDHLPAAERGGQRRGCSDACGRGRRPLRRGGRGGQPRGAPAGERREQLSYPEDLRSLVDRALEDLTFSAAEPTAGLEEA